MGLDVQGAAAGCARFRGRVSLRLAAVVASLFLPILAAHAQSQPTSSPEDEYKKLIKVSEDIQPLGETPFGERISLYDGSLSFDQTDISFPGQGPTITLGRLFALHTADERRDQQYRAFGDWDIDIPVLATITPVKSGIRLGWLVAAGNQKAICSSFTLPPSVPGIGGDSTRADWEPESWWQGYQMHIPGQGTQELLRRSTANTAAPGGNAAAYPIVTKQDWSVGCLAQTVNDATREGFLAVAPDGTKYYFNRLSYRSMPGVSRPTNSGPGFAMARTDATMSPMAALDDILVREEARMLVTRIEDRFGNGINYTYDGNSHLTNIDGDDQRHVTIAYGADGNRVASVTMQGGAAGTRTWQYAYTQVGPFYQLSSVIQPDGSKWSYDLAVFNSAFVDMQLSAGNCAAIGTPSNLGVPYTSSMTHPSGLTANFTVTPVKRGRSYVPQECKAGPNMPATPNGVGTHAAIPNASYSMAITKKQFSGAGIDTQIWDYVYSPSNESWSIDCSAGCTASVWTRVKYPDGHYERSTFSNRYNYSESLLLSEEVFDGAVDVSRRRKYVSYNYLDPADARAAAYPSPWGTTRARLNPDQLQKKFPMASQVVQIDDDQSADDTYTWNALSYDSFARPKDVQRYSSIGYAVEEKTSFQDDYAHWVLGLPLQTATVTANGDVVVSRNVYNPTTLTLSERYRFGRKVMGYAFNAQGQLASFTDGNNETTTLGGYKRGIPQSIGYPDGTSQSLVVDDLGQIASITNQAHATTSYTYDPIGRLASITYPTGMNPKVFGYGYVTGAERGVAANHWRRSVTQGSKVQMTYFDAMLRPILNDTYRSDFAMYTSLASGYDWKGRKTFQSYPYSGGPAIATMVNGVYSGYDVLGRQTASTQISELGNLTTTTQYQSGASKKVTDPKGNATTSWYQVFDQPSYDTVVKVQAPENVLQTIARDVYGNPLSITQGGAGQSITKTMTYDAYHRLCRTWEPESGSEIMAYDGADNLAWSVSGASFNLPGQCGQDQVDELAKTVRTYDGMNRVTSVLYPTGTAPSTFTYDALGNPATATSDTVGWTFGHNALGQLTAEVLSVDGWVWGLGYGYDLNGALSTVRYPDEEIVAYNPDALGRPTTVGGYANGLTYFTDGDVESYNLGSGATYSADKNTRNLLSNFTYGKGSTLNISEDFTYDANGNLAVIKDWATADQRTKVMSYDGLNRLLSATADKLWGTESYTYDTLNNIRTLTNSSGTNTYNYSDGTNRLNSITSAGAQVHAFQYDVRGNTTGKDDQILNFDLANRLVSITDRGNYTYDAAGRRVKKIVPGGATTYYAYNSAGQLMWEADPVARLGSNYVYLGKKLIAKSTENIDILHPSQVRTTLSIVGVPKLSLDGTTIDVVLDIANSGSRPLTANSQYPVQMGYHLIDASGASTLVEPGVNLPADIPVGAHGTITVHVAAPAVLGTSKKIRFSLLQAGVAWFQDWPGNTTVDAGPYSACPTTGTGNLCNNVTGLTQEQVNVALTITSGPTLSADGQDVSTTIDIANHGSVTLASMAPHPVQLGNHLITGAGALYQNDVTRAAIPEIAPGQHAAVTISTPASLLLGSDRRVQFELVQEGVHWFKDFGFTPVVAGPYATLGGVTSSINGSFALSWQPIAGATSYNLQEKVNGGAWSTVQGSAVTSWSTSGRATGTYAYQVQACGANGCAPYGPAWTVNVLLPPPVPASIAATAPVPGPITVTWADSATATRYVVNQQFNGGAWTTYYNAAGTSVVLSPAATGTYVYQVQACNSSGCSGFRQSNAVSITRPPASAPGIAGGGANHNGAYTISWSGVAGAATYNLVESENGGAWMQRQNTAAGSWSTSSRVNGTYVYQVQACNAGGCGPWSGQAVVTVTLPPAAPGWPSVSQSGPSYKPVVLVKWASVLYATRYELQEILPSGYTTTVQNSSATSWSSLKLFTGTLQYKFRACNDVGCSAWSPTVAINLVSGG